jgi:hypothetical protein
MPCEDQGPRAGKLFQLARLSRFSRVAASPQRFHKAMTLQHSGDYRVNSAMEAK